MLSCIPCVLALVRTLYTQPRAQYLLQISGDAMGETGINHGDVVAVDCTASPRSGDIVVVELNGTLLVRQFWRENGTTQLRVANPRYHHITVVPRDSFAVLGVVKGVHKQLKIPQV